MNGQKLNQFWNQPSTCICGHPMEDRIHQLLDCPTYTDIREYCISQMINILISHHPWVITERKIRKRISLIHLILDPSWYRSDIGSATKGLPNILTPETANKIETIGRVFCFKIYKRRFAILSEEEEGSDAETEADSNYSLHDTTEASDTDDSITSTE